MPVIIRELSDDDAAIAMVDSNLQQREKLLYSEKAWAYRVKMEALNHKDIKAETHSADIISSQTGDNKCKVFKIICLTELVESLLDKADSRDLAFNTAVELTYLEYTEQFTVADVMEKYSVKPSLSQAVRFKKMKEAGTLSPEVIDEVLSEVKESPVSEVKESPVSEVKESPVSEAKITLHCRKFFPPEYSPKQVEEVIIALLKDWRKTQMA
jgi:ParB family chromosome partitioning protein